MPLTDVQIRNAKPAKRPVKANRKDKKSPSLRDGNTKGNTAHDKIEATKEAPKFIATDKPYKMSDGGGLYLEVDPAGGKYWRFKYRFAGKEKRISLGVYGDVSLAEAREKRDSADYKSAALPLELQVQFRGAGSRTLTRILRHTEAILWR